MASASEDDVPRCPVDQRVVSLIAVSTVFASLGRGIVCLDAGFRILHVSSLLEELLGAERATGLLGRPVEELLGSELFGRDGTVRQALAAGERREGWRSFIEGPDGPRAMSVTAAPFVPDPDGICDRTVAYVVVVRPAEQDPATGTGAPTVFSGLIARSASMARIFALVEQLSSSDATVLLSGESGTGKEVVARAIHASSPHKGGPFVGVNCGALPSELLESELFGHVRGAFTSAVRDRKGRFEAAAGGTLFLDEIGDMPLPLQVKLLRVLQEHRFERVGESRSTETDARIIAATNADLRRAVAEGRFRDDLYYRLRVVPIEIPPLRARREDIEPLARFLLSRVAARHGRQMLLSPAALRALLGYPWPGNVRELENALEYAVAVGRGQTLQVEDLPDEVRAPASSGAPGPSGELAHVAAAPADGDEAARLRSVLDACRWSRAEAARQLGMSRTTLWRKMRELRIGG